MKDLVSVYEFQRLILNVEFFEDFFGKGIRNVGVENPGFLPTPILKRMCL